MDNNVLQYKVHSTDYKAGKSQESSKQATKEYWLHHSQARIVTVYFITIYFLLTTEYTTHMKKNNP
jgi:hypothetical protein